MFMAHSVDNSRNYRKVDNGNYLHLNTSHYGILLRSQKDEQKFVQRVSKRRVEMQKVLRQLDAIHVLP